MNIKMLDKKKDRIKLQISGIDVAYANTLRRLMSHDVPTMAIEVVEFRQNSSALYDEMIAHRLGLVPLKTDLDSYIMPSESKGAGDARAELKLTLKVTGPKTVYSGDLKSKDPKVKPVFPDIPIVKLLEDQELELEATAILGVGKDHAKFSPGFIFYTGEPKVKVNNSSKNFDNVKSRYPKKAFDKSGKLDASLIVKNELVDAVTGIDEDVVKVDYVKDSFIFTVETWGQLEPTAIVTKAIDMFNRQLNELSGLFKDS